MHAFWLVLTYDPFDDRRIDDVIIKTFFNSLLFNTNRFQVAVCLFSNRSQMMSKCGKNISDTLGCASCATFLFLLHFDVICDLLLNGRTARRINWLKCILSQGDSSERFYRLEGRMLSIIVVLVRKEISAHGNTYHPLIRKLHRHNQSFMAQVYRR